MRSERPPASAGLNCCQVSTIQQTLIEACKQDPENERKRIYKVFDKIEDVRQDEETTGHQILGSAKVGTNKAIRSAVESALTTKAASSSSGGDGLDLWAGITIGAEKPKKNPKPKKERSPEEMEKKQFDTELLKILGLGIFFS